MLRYSCIIIPNRCFILSMCLAADSVVTSVCNSRTVLPQFMQVNPKISILGQLTYLVKLRKMEQNDRSPFCSFPVQI